MLSVNDGKVILVGEDMATAVDRLTGLVVLWCLVVLVDGVELPNVKPVCCRFK